MDQANPVTSSQVGKPIAGLIVVLFVATVIGGWLYVDFVRSDLEMKIQALESQTRQSQALQPAAEENGSRVTAPTLENGWQSVTSAKQGYSLMIPPGYRFSDGTSIDTIAYVIPDPTDEMENSLPVMTITVTSAAAAEQHPGKMIQVGDKAYWFSLWEDMEWEQYDVVVGSFKAK